jgi:lysophospholipase L1-like esterase
VHAVTKVFIRNLTDGVHFDSAGYGEFARLVLEQLKPLL